MTKDYKKLFLPGIPSYTLGKMHSRNVVLYGSVRKEDYIKAISFLFFLFLFFFFFFYVLNSSVINAVRQ